MGVGGWNTLKCEKEGIVQKMIRAFQKDPGANLKSSQCPNLGQLEQKKHKQIFLSPSCYK